LQSHYLQLTTSHFVTINQLKETVTHSLAMTESGSIQNEGLEEVTKQLGFLVHLRSSVATLVQLALENQGAPAGTYTQLNCPVV